MGRGCRCGRRAHKELGFYSKTLGSLKTGSDKGQGQTRDLKLALASVCRG